MIGSSGLVCPHCQRADKVEKVSEIVADGFSTTPFEGAEATQWADQIYYIRYQERPPTGELIATKPSQSLFKEYSYNWNSTPRARITISPLSDRLLPQIERPDPPPDFTKWRGCRYVLIWPMLKIVRRLYNWTYKRLEANYSHKRKNLPQAQIRWSELFYCYRCEGVFKEEGELKPVGQFNNYLFDLTPDRWFKKL